MSGPKRQHHLPQAVQRNYLDNGESKLWWYSRKTDNYELRVPRSIAHARNTYTFSSATGDERYALEEAFSKLENSAIPALRKLQHRLDITPEEHFSVSEYIGFQFLRTPSKIKVIQDLTDVGAKQGLITLAAKAAQMSEVEFQDFRSSYDTLTKLNSSAITREIFVEGLRKRIDTIRSTKDFHLGQMVKLANELGIEYSKRKWIILHTNRKKSLIASNEGLFLAKDSVEADSGLGPLAKGVSTVMPFSRTAALLIVDEPISIIDHRNISSSVTNNINNGLAVSSNEIYSHSKALLESVVKRNKLYSAESNIFLSSIDVTTFAQKFFA